MEITNSVKNFFLGNPKKVIHVPLNSDSVQDNHQVKALAYENAEIKGDNAKLKSVIAKLKQRDEDKNEEENVKAVLNKKRNEIILKSQGQIFSLKKFYSRYLRDKKFKDRLGIYSFDRSTRLADFGDFGITEDGDFALLDREGNLILRMQTLPDMLQSVGALGNDMSRGMVPVNLDKEGGYFENIMIQEMAEIIPTDSGKLKYAKARKRPVYEIIQGLNNRIIEISSELSESEALNIEFQNKIDSLTSENKINQEMSETSRAELSHYEQRTMGIDKSFRMIQRNMSDLQNINIMQEDNIAKLENEIGIMREKAEREGVKLSDEKSLEIIKNIRATVVNELPDVQHVNAEKPEGTNKK
ncbi:MAG: hypothetical protein U9Q73_00445 [Nanoarchaeota archaeon]|nr:hypothetical protein [Nanoarchaeota archaeon]